MTTVAERIGPARVPRRRPAWLRSAAETLGPAVAVGLIVPMFFGPGDLFLWTTAAIYVLFALSANVLFGWTGMASFGQAAYFGGGAYFVALLHDEGWSPLVLLVGAGLAGLVLAVLFGVFAARVAGIEFAMLTLVFAQSLNLLTYKISGLGGENGLPGIERGALFGLDLTEQLSFWWLVIAVVALLALLLRRLQRSSFGVSLNAVRDDEVKAASLGIPVRRVRLAAFVLAGAIAGVAGGLFAQQQGTVSPATLYWVLSGNVIIMCLLGGLHRFWGPAVGALAFVWAEHLLLEQTDAPTLFTGIVFLLVVLALPEGLTGLPARLRRRPAVTEERA